MNLSETPRAKRVGLRQVEERVGAGGGERENRRYADSFSIQGSSVQFHLKST